MFFEDEENVMVAQFGTGDIHIVPGVVRDLNAGSVSLVDNCGKCMPINEAIMSDDDWAKHRAAHGVETDHDLNTVVRLVFTEPGSIDALIWGLEEAKKYMTEKL